MQECLEIIQHTVTRMHRHVVGDIVAIIFQRRRKKRQQPETGHAQTLEEIQLLAQAFEIADTVRVAVMERLDGKLVDDGVFVPEWIVARRRSSHESALPPEAAPVPKRIVFWHPSSVHEGRGSVRLARTTQATPFSFRRWDSVRRAENVAGETDSGRGTHRRNSARIEPRFAPSGDPRADRTTCHAAAFCASISSYGARGNAARRCPA